MAMSLSTTYTGRVVAVNDRGLRLDGHESWYNVSKFAPDVTLPPKGETVTVSIDSKGFLRSVERADGAELTPARIAGGSDPAPSTKDRTITRLAILKAAAEFGASRPALKSGDVLTIAASWERWVTRETGSDDEPVDAF
jgi:hypothetical protein